MHQQQQHPQQQPETNLPIKSKLTHGKHRQLIIVLVATIRIITIIL